MFSNSQRTTSLKHEPKIYAHHVISTKNSEPSNLEKNTPTSHLRNPLNHRTRASPAAKSSSKPKRTLSSKLFAKAHQAGYTETYLSVIRPNTDPSSSKYSHATGPRISNALSLNLAQPTSSKIMEVHHQFDIKISAAEDHDFDELSSLSRIIKQFSVEGLILSNLSSIRQNGEDSPDLASSVSESSSLLRLIQA